MKINIDLEREEILALFTAIGLEKAYCKDDINSLQENTNNLKNILDNSPNHYDGANIYQDIAENEQEIEILKNHILVLDKVEDKLNKSLPK